MTAKGAAGTQAGLALEEDFQRLLASELHHHSRRRYIVTVESHTAEWKRRDVLCSHDAWHASIEPKMSERWTVEDYLVALEDQLVGQYMRNDRATTGFLVLVLQKPRHWKFEGRWIEFPEVLSILTAKAQALEAANRSLNLRVIGIDATPPSSFRFDGAGAKRPSKAVASRKSRRRSTQR